MQRLRMFLLGGFFLCIAFIAMASFQGDLLNAGIESDGINVTIPNGNLTLTTGNLVLSAGDQTLTGDTTQVGDLTLTGDVTTTGDVTMNSGDLTLSDGDVAVTGNTALTGTLGVTGAVATTGAVTLNSGNLYLSSGALSVTGNMNWTGRTKITPTTVSVTSPTVTFSCVAGSIFVITTDESQTGFYPTNGTVGQICTFIGTSDSATVQFDDGTSMALSGNATLGVGDTLTVFCDSAEHWVELAEGAN